MPLQPRESIPNVGRRAQGRKTLFMLKGSGFITDVTDVDNDVRKARQQNTHDSLFTSGGETGGSGELLEPVSYDESVLSQPSHPYNRIIQRILHRRVAERKEYGDQTGGHVTSRAERKCGLGTATSLAPPNNISRDHHSHSSDLQRPCLVDLRLSKPGLLKTDREESNNKIKREDSDQKLNRRAGKPENELRLQWADILRADHYIVKNRYDLQLCDVSSTDDRSVSYISSKDNMSVSSLDLARGYLTDRGLQQDDSQASSALDDLTAGEILDTTRSDPLGISSLPHLSRKRDLHPLDDVLDYFWVYQGMSRQILDRTSPDDLWNRRFFKKKPTRLPPIYIATGLKSMTSSSTGTIRKSESASSGSTIRKNEVTSSAGESSSGLSSQDAGTPRGTSQEEKVETGPDCDLSSHQDKKSAKKAETEADSGQNSHWVKKSAGSDLDCRTSDVWIQSHAEAKCTRNHCHDNDDTWKPPSSESENEERVPARRVTLVVKMPVVTQESSCADLLEND